jgi:hypothetical protein
VWVHPEVPNPAFVDDKTVYNVCEDGCTGVGFELWQVQAGTIFDDVIVTDSVEEAEAFAAATLIYLLVNLCVVLAMRKLENHLRLPGYIGSASNAPQAGH